MCGFYANQQQIGFLFWLDMVMALIQIVDKCYIVL